MKLNRRMVIGVVTVALLAAGGAGIAQAVGSGSEERVKGPDAEQAKRAALAAVGGGTVLEVERQDGDGQGAFEVEVRRDDGSEVEVHLDAAFQPVGTEADDDSGSDSEDDDQEGDETDE